MKLYISDNLNLCPLIIQAIYEGRSVGNLQFEAISRLQCTEESRIFSINVGLLSGVD